MLARRAMMASVLVALVGAGPAAADPGPDNPNAATRTLACDDGRTVDATFAGEAGSNFNVTIDQSVFVYKLIAITRPPFGLTEVETRGIQGFDPSSLTTCNYTSPSGNLVTVIGFFTPRARR